MTSKESETRAMSGANGDAPRVPKWIAALDAGVKEGDWYISLKARRRRMMLDSLSSEARRVYECLELATVGFQTEVAVVLERGKRRDMRPDDIVQQTGLSRQKVRDALEELEQQELARREADDEGALRKGHVRIRCWAVPRSAVPKIVPSRGYKIPGWLPEDSPLQPLLKRWKVEIADAVVPARADIEAAEAAAREYETAEMRVRERIDALRASAAHIRKKGTERNSERNGSSPEVLSTAQSSSSSLKNAEPTTTTTQANKNTPPQNGVPEKVWRFATGNTARKVSRLRVFEYWELCREVAAKRGEALTEDDVVAIMEQTLEAAEGAIDAFVYYLRAADDQTQAYLDHRAEPKAAAAGAGNARTRDSFAQRFFRRIDGE